MFSKVALFVAASMAVFATALPAGGSGSCNTGEMHCCNQTQTAQSVKKTDLAALLGLDLGSIQGLVGTSCTPLTAVGLAGNSCSQQPVCCTDNHFNGLVVVGCSPINVNA